MVTARPKGFLSIRTKLTLILVSFLAITLGTLGAFLNAHNTNTVHEESRRREELFARNVQLSINRVLFAGKYQAQAYLEALAEGQPDLRYIMILDKETQRAIAHTDPEQVGRAFGGPVTDRALEALTAGGLVAQDYVSGTGEPIHDYALPYVRGYLREQEGVIRIGISGATEEALLRQSRLYALALIVGFLIAGTGLSILLAVRVTSSVTRLAEATRRFGGGEEPIAVPVPARPRDELDELGLAFNQMAARIRDYAENLESQVKQRTAELQATEAKLQAFFDNANTVIFLKDREGRFILVNREFERLFGLSRDQIVGKTDDALFTREVAARFQADDRKVLDSHRAIEFEEIVPTPEGARTYLSIKFPLLDAEGRPFAVGGIATDITERKALEQRLRDQYDQLKEVDRLKSEFVNAISHDLRTPLTSIRGYAEFLEDGIGGELSETQVGFVNQIDKGARRLEHLVDDLLDYARIEAGTFKLKLEEADLAAQIEEIAGSLRPQAEEARLDLTLDLPEEPLVLQIDARRVQQVLTNLLHNALKFTPPGGSIVVRARREGDQMHCAITDTGPGIAPADQARLFVPFSQLQRGMAKGGTGLGLSISKTIVERHGGAIGVESAPGEGSTFWFTLPVAGPPNAA